MQSIPGYPTGFDVAEPAALVTVNGVPYDVESLTVTRELSSNLPEQVTSASGYTAATGSVEWVVGEDVQERAAHPWDGNNFPPKPADSVVAYMGYGDVMVRQLTGVIDRSNGSVAQGSVSSDVVDTIDKLNQPVTFPAHLHVFPPHEDGGAFLLVGNEPTFTTDRILRACGFYATPPQDSGCILSVPLMGSAWPEVGRVDTASQQGFPAYPAAFSASQWGMAADSIQATYTPDLSKWPNGRLDKTVQVTLKARSGASPSGNSFVRAWWGAAHVVLIVTSDRRVIAQLFDGATFITMCSLTAAQALTADAFTLRVTPAGVFTIYASNGTTATGTRALPAAMTGNNIGRVEIVTPHTTGVSIGGVQIGFSTASTWTHPTTAILTPAAKSWSLGATPRIDNRTALDVLKEQAEAECASIWIDEHGVFRWVNRDVLTGSTPVATLTPLDILDIGWESNADGVRSKVELTWNEPSVSRSDVTNKTVWQGPGGSLDPTQEDIQLVEIPSDQEWVGVDESVSRVTNVSGWLTEFNRGRQSWWGGIEENDTDERWAHTSNPGFSTTVEKVGAFAYRFTTKAGTPTPGYTIELRTPGEAFSQSLRRSKAGFNLPVLRAKAIVEWSERKTTGAALGPTRAAALEHHVGPWVQDAAALQSLADWLAAQVAAPRPVLRDLDVIPDFRRQLGDIVWVEDPDNMRIRLKVLLTKISTTVSPGSAEQSVAGQILQVQSYGPTNAQLDAHAGKFTNSGFDTLWADASNAQFDTDPLGRG